MAKLNTAPYKGVRDFYPEDQFYQNYIFGIWRKTLESFGFEEYGASILELGELYRSKGSDEIVNEQTYTFIDKGDREVTLRPEMTPTVARMVAAKRRELAFPLRWYSIPNLFRYEAPQRGRLREHWQLNADIFGISNQAADVEIIQIAHALMKNFGSMDYDFEIRINNRGELENRLSGYISEEEKPAFMRLLDKKAKMSEEEFKAEMIKSFGREINFNMEDPGEETKAIIAVLENLGINNIKFDPNMVRGFNYYTGTVFEIFDTDPENPRSIFGGGRYNELTKIFNEEEIPAVGFGSGDVTMKDFLTTHNLLPPYKSTTKLYIATLSPEQNIAVETLATTLREAGINVAVDWTHRKAGDQIRTADRHSIPYCILIGQDEVTTETYRLKYLPTGEEKLLQLDELIDTLK
jgi:histidyl-tRNA synthetase